MARLANSKAQRLSSAAKEAAEKSAALGAPCAVVARGAFERALSAVLSGHGFNRAVSAAESVRLLAAEVSLCALELASRAIYVAPR